MLAFVYLASVCRSLPRLISALTLAGRGGLLFRLLVPSRCGEGLALFSPSTLLRLPAALYGACPRAARGSSPPVFHKSAEQKAAPALCVFPVRDAQAARSSRGTLSPARRAACPPHPRPQSPPALVGCLWPVSRGDSPGGCGPSRISGGL